MKEIGKKTQFSNLESLRLEKIEDFTALDHLGAKSLGKYFDIYFLLTEPFFTIVFTWLFISVIDSLLGDFFLTLTFRFLSTFDPTTSRVC